MKRKGLLITLAIAAVVGVLWLLASGRVDSTTLTSALGLKPASDKRSASTSKPICSQVIVPARVTLRCVSDSGNDANRGIAVRDAFVDAQAVTRQPLINKFDCQLARFLARY